MNQTTVLSSPSEAVLSALLDGLDGFAPEVRKAAAYVAEHPDEVALTSIRKLAEVAGVKPNALVRLARGLGFDGFDSFREPFRESLSSERNQFPDRARWLQALARRDGTGPLFSESADTSLANIESLYRSVDAAELKAAARAIVDARTTYVVGVGVAWSLAHMFAYLGRMAFDNFIAVPRDGSLPIDDIARADARDLLVAMSFKPYRSEIVEVIEAAADQRVKVIGISDAATSPITRSADFGFVVPTQTPQFFTSMVAVSALLETLMAFAVSQSGEDVVKGIERFHAQRYRHGVYVTDAT